MQSTIVIVNLLGAVAKLLGFDGEQVATGIDADIGELCRLLSELGDLLQITLALLFGGLVGLVESLAAGAIGDGKEMRGFRPQEQGAIGDAIQELPVMAGHDHNGLARQGRHPVFERQNAAEIKMVGGLVKQ